MAFLGRPCGTVEVGRVESLQYWQKSMPPSLSWSDWEIIKHFAFYGQLISILHLYGYKFLISIDLVETSWVCADRFSPARSYDFGKKRELLIYANIGYINKYFIHSRCNLLANFAVGIWLFFMLNCISFSKRDFVIARYDENSRTPCTIAEYCLQTKLILIQAFFIISLRIGEIIKCRLS